MSHSALPETEAYDVSVKITHPTWSSRRITEAMLCHPDISWTVGEAHSSPGLASQGRKRKNTYWCVWHYVEGHRNFFKEFKAVCEWLCQRKSFLEDLEATGGDVEVDIGLRGSANIGATLDPVHLRSAADLGIRLGIEVFPQMNRERKKKVPWEVAEGGADRR